MDFLVLGAVDFVWNDVLLNPMTNALIFLSNVLFGNFGLAIIAFTLITRFATYPLTIKQLRTTRAMQEMQPRLQEIQKKYKDPKRRQQEMMKLYREVGFNPLGCAVPFIIQIPIWIALFQVIRRTMGSTPEALLGLSGRLYDWSFITEAVPLDRNFLFLDLSNPSIPLAFLVAIATFFQQKFSMTRSTAGNDRQASTNRTLLYIMPLLFGWFTITVPSGLGLYWLVTSLFGVAMAYLYHKPKNLSWRWLFSLEALPLQPTGAGSAKVVTVPAGDTERLVESAPTTEQPAAGKGRRRRRRRRSSRPSNPNNAGDGKG